VRERERERESEGGRWREIMATMSSSLASKTIFLKGSRSDSSSLGFSHSSSSNRHQISIQWHRQRGCRPPPPRRLGQLSFHLPFLSQAKQSSHVFFSICYIWKFSQFNSILNFELLWILWSGLIYFSNFLFEWTVPFRFHHKIIKFPIPSPFPSHYVFNNQEDNILHTSRYKDYAA